ncbi:MAG: helix-turn-helix domain-containing protein [Ruminococcus sp.]|nr:helix-turn-helix domain-containing protein [Ruminococcus sp.]
MDQEKIGKFIAESRKKKNLTQENIALKLGVSINAVSKWERGICLMDMSLLKPLSEILDVKIIDILAGEKVDSEVYQEKYDETIDNLLKLEKIKSKSFGIYGMLFIYVIILIYKVEKNICFFDIVSILCGFNAFKFFYKYKLDKNKGNLIISIVSMMVCLFLLFVYVKATS